MEGAVAVLVEMFKQGISADDALKISQAILNLRNADAAKKYADGAEK